MASRTLSRIALSLLAATVLQPNTQAQGKSTPQQQLEGRITKLEERLDAAEKKATTADKNAETATLQNEYVKSVQSQAHSYYDKAFNTLVTIVSIGVLAIGFFSFRVFDERAKRSIATTTTKLEASLNTKIRAELETLREQNTKQLKTLEESLTQRITSETNALSINAMYSQTLSQGATLSVANEHRGARIFLRLALRTLVDHRDVLKQRRADVAITAVLTAIRRANPQDFAGEAKKELTDDLYQNFEDELNAAAVTSPDLAPIVREVREGWQKKQNTASPRDKG